MRVGRIVFFLLLAVVTIAGVAGCQKTGGTGGGTSNTTSTAIDISAYVGAWAESTHSVPVVFAAQRPPCAGCHDGRAFMQGVSDPKQIQGPTPFGTWVVATDCRACHVGRGADVMQSGVTTIPSSPEPVKGGKGALCMSCHNQEGEADITDKGLGYPHYGPQADVLNATGGMTQGLNLMSTDKHKNIDNTCVACHMKKGGESHRFEPTETQCPRCHKNFDTAEKVKAGGDYDGDGQTEVFVDEVQGLMDALAGAVNAKAGSTKFAAQSGHIAFTGSNDTTLSTVPPQAYMGAYNWVLINHDKSRGIHNPFFTVSLLQETYRAVTGTELANAVKPKPSSK